MSVKLLENAVSFVQLCLYTFPAGDVSKILSKKFVTSVALSNLVGRVWG